MISLFTLWCLVVHQQRIQAPAGWYVNGVRPDGSYELRPVLGRPQDDLTDAWQLIDLDGPAPVRGWIDCDHGAEPRQDGVSLWCQR